ncbi:MAG TPA: tetratricopeptide repeat protein, partial [Polyangiaceae bacterium]
HTFAVPGETSLDALSSPAPSEPLTLTGSVLGTVGYMAPEQAFGEPTNAASDQFSFCATLYFALYGRRPFAGDDLTSYFAAIQRPLPPPPVTTGGAAVPQWLQRILARGLSLDPHARFPSMEALLDALEEDPETIFKKRRTFAIAAVLVAAAVALGIAGLRRNPGECLADPADLRGIWDDAARKEVAASFAQTGAPAAEDTAARVVKILDDTAAKWTAMKTESCEATRVRKRQSEDDYKLRSECLERRRSELGALSSSLRVADKGVVEKAVAAAYGLTSVAFCADVPMLRKSGGLPDAPQARAQVLEARTELAKASSLELVGKVKESTGVAAHALTLARASGHESTVAEALRTVGGLEVEQNEYADAERSLSEATWAASRVGADSLVVSGASITAFVVGSKLGRPGEARIWLSVADAALHRVGASQELQLEYEEHKAWLLSDGDARPEETIPTQEHIAQAYQELYGTHPRSVRALYNLGDARTSSGDHARACDAYARALTMAEAIGGAGYSWTGYALEGRGDCLAAQGKYAEGDEALARALRVFEANGDDYTQGEVLEVVIRSALAQGDIERAVKTARRTMGLLKAQEDAASLLAIADVPVAEALMHVPPAPEAEALCGEALREQEKLGQIDPSKTLRADALRCLGEARLLAGHPREALTPLERSVTLERRTYPGDLARARFALARALVESGGDAARALALAQQARDDFASAPGLGYELGVVQGWLAARK